MAKDGISASGGAPTYVLGISEAHNCTAAIHPFDKTMRPQILRQSDNRAYHGLIRSFEDMIGIGAVLNTSFNLHGGEPVVCNAKDAVKTFVESGLRNLSLSPYMISKNREG